MVNYAQAPAPEWVHGETGEVIEAVGRIVKTSQMVAVEGLFSQEFDLFCAGHSVGEGGEIDAKLIDGETVVSKRGKIIDFSRRSQARLMKALSGWEPVGDLMIVTLTYGAEFPNMVRAKADFERFRRLVRKQLFNWCGLWKLELQKRGAPHFHLVIDSRLPRGSVDIKATREIVNDLWMRARWSGQPARTQCDFARNPSRAKMYLCKEVGKMVQSSREWRAEVESAVEHHGRVWGWLNPSAMRFEADEFVVPAAIGFLFRTKIQELVETDMQKRGAVKFVDGQWRHRNGEVLDRSRLPSWQLLDDPDTVFSRICEDIKSETGFDIRVDARRAEPAFEFSNTDDG